MPPSRRFAGAFFDVVLLARRPMETFADQAQGDETDRRILPLSLRGRGGVIHKKQVGMLAMRLYIAASRAQPAREQIERGFSPHGFGQPRANANCALTANEASSNNAPQRFDPIRKRMPRAPRP